MLANLVLGAAMAAAQSTLPASQFVFQSAGGLVGTDYQLNNYGYIGTFLSLKNPATVTIKVLASGQQALGSWPQMGLHVGNSSFSFTVANAGFETYQKSVALPAGDTLLRIEFLNFATSGSQSRTLTLRSVSVSAPSAAGSAIVNPTNTTALHTECFTAANSTIENYRKQTATVQLVNSKGAGLKAGTAVQFQLTKHAFRFGTAVAGTGATGDPMWADQPAGSTNAVYQAAILSNFNLIEEENAGKWAYTEPVEGQPAMQYVDAILDFGHANGLSVRHHNVLWGAQQPQWAIDLENTALGSDSQQATQAATQLWDAINFRIGYVVLDRSPEYQELDCINEASQGHQPVFLDIYGYNGLGQIWNNSVNAVRQAHASTHVYFNDYNILNYNSDVYAGWYLDFIRTVENSGVTALNRPLLGIGIQYYNIGSIDHNPTRIYQSLANLGTLRLPISLTEFGVDGGFSSEAPQILQDTLNLVFGTDQATTFNMWDFWQPWMWVDGAALFDSNWNITLAGMIWQQMTGIKNWNLPGVPNWTTNVTLTTDSTGSVSFRGFAGDYSITAASAGATMNLAIGTAKYKVTVE